MTQKCGGGRGSAPGELTTLPKTPTWMRERLRAGKGKMGGVKGRRGKYEMGRGKRGEKRGKGKGPASQGRDRRRGKGMGRGLVKGGGRGKGRAGASIQWGMTHVASLKFQGNFVKFCKKVMQFGQSAATEERESQTDDN